MDRRLDAYTGECVVGRRRRRAARSARSAARPTCNPVPDATWGLHLVDANIALGNLTDDVARQAKFWLQANSKPKKKQH